MMFPTSAAGEGVSVMLMKRLSVVLCLLMSAPAPRAQDFTPVNILIPKFQSPKGDSADVGWRAASILGLQIWRTYGSPTEKESAFDNAEFFFEPESRPTTYAEVESFAKRRKNKANLVLWGAASQYGDGIVVEAYLLVRKGAGKNRLGTDIWSVTIPTGKNSHTISVDIPDSQYEFAPIILDNRLIKKFEYESRRLSHLGSQYWGRSKYMGGLGVYTLKSISSEPKGVFTDFRIHAIRHEDDWSFVRLEGEGSGWVYLPQLSQNPSEVVNFCGGLIRILRNDFRGAVSLFQEVVNTDRTPTAVKIDSYLYMALAYDKLGDDEKRFSMIAQAYELSPYSKATTQYLCMSYLTNLARLLRKGAAGEDAKKEIRSVQELVSKNRVLFAEDDGWIKQVEQVLAELTAQGGGAPGGLHRRS